MSGQIEGEVGLARAAHGAQAVPADLKRLAGGKRGADRVRDLRFVARCDDVAHRMAAELLNARLRSAAGPGRTGRRRSHACGRTRRAAVEGGEHLAGIEQALVVERAFHARLGEVDLVEHGVHKVALLHPVLAGRAPPTSTHRRRMSAPKLSAACSSPSAFAS